MLFAVSKSYFVRFQGKTGSARAWDEIYVPMRSGADSGFDAAARRHNVDDVFAVQYRSQIPERRQRRPICGVVAWLVVEMIDGERLIVAQGEQVRVGQEAGGIDGAAVVVHLDERVVFVWDGDVVYVDEAVGAAGEETLWQRGMESHDCYVVVVAFDVLLQRSAGRTHVPVTVMSSFCGKLRRDERRGGGRDHKSTAA